MTDLNYKVRAIGRIHSPYLETKDAPKQGSLRDEISEIEIYPEFVEGLRSIEELTHVIVIYWGHLGYRQRLVSQTPWSTEERGVFATRSPNRPNPLALCVCRLVKRADGHLLVKGLDAIDGSFVLDIKSYSAGIDSFPDAIRKNKG